MSNTLLEEGAKVTDFTLQTTSGAPFILSQLKSEKLLLFFYPKDSTPGCTMEAKDFRDNIEQFELHQVHVLGVSMDNLKSHEKFAESCDLPFPLASDPTGEVCKQFNVLKEKSLFGKKYTGIVRSSFLIDKEGMLIKAWRDISALGHVKEILAYLK